MIATCPEQALLDKYLAGKSSREFHDDFESHLRDCRDCQARLSQFNPTEDSLMRVLRDVVLGGGEGNGQNDPALSSAMASIASLGNTQAAGINGNDSPGRVIRDYELKKKLGEGGMGAVYLALHTRLKKQVAVKLLKADHGHAGAIARFAVEIEAVGKLEHPNIVRALDAGEENGTHFLVMEYLPGIDLSRLVRGLGPLGVADICEIIRQAALGLHHAHENEIVHRDVKPSNFILLPSGKIKVLDLGLAHFRPALHETGLTQDNQVLGTLLYLAPEQFSASGKVDARSDIYSLGVTLYELLLGRLPSRQGLVLSPTVEELAARSDVPPEIWELAKKMISVNRDDRPNSMLEVADAVRPFVIGANLASLLQQLMGQSTLEEQHAAGGVGSGSPSHWPTVFVTPPPVPPALMTHTVEVPPPPPRRDSKFWPIAAAALTLVCLVLAVLVYTNWPASPSDTTTAEKPAIPPAPSGHVTVRSSDADYGAILAAMVEQGVVFAIAQPSGEKYQLKREENELPVGEYVLEGRESECKIAHREFTVTAGASLVVSPGVEFAGVWLKPEIPERPGEYCDWLGQLWHLHPGQTRAEGMIPFRLTLSAQGNVNMQGRPHRWLKISVFDQKHHITETAWLLIDVAHWEQQRELQWPEGKAWICADSEPLKEALADAELTGPLCVPFDKDEDRLAAAANGLNEPLPVDRVGVHQVLVLLFDQTVPYAPKWMTMVRSMLPAERTYHLESVTTSRGAWPGLVVKANVAAEGSSSGGISLLLERTEAVPFRFAQVKVDSPLFYCGIKLNGFSLPTERVDAEKLPTFQDLAKKIDELPRVAHPLDRPDLPRVDEPLYVVYLGTIKSPSADVSFKCELRSRGLDTADGYRWLEVSTESGVGNYDHKERALICINESAYGSGDFQIKQGWLTVGEHVFSFDPQGDLGGIEEALLRLDAPLPAARFGVHDLLSLMFDADLKASRFGTVRAAFGRQRIPERTRQDFHLEETGENFATTVFDLDPTGSGAGKGTYRIQRGRKIPFSFADVKITSPTGMEFSAKLWKMPLNERNSPPRRSELSLRVEQTWRSVADAEKREPNWQLWDLKSSKSRLWAEYVGTIGSKVLLRDKKEFVTLDQTEIHTDDDLEAVARGRQWYSSGGKPFFRGELLGKADSRSYRFVILDDGPNRGKPVLRLKSEFTERERVHIDELVKLLPKAEPLPAIKGSRVTPRSLR